VSLSSLNSLQLSLAQPTCLIPPRRQRLYIPDAFRILVNTPITAKETHARYTSNTLTDPLILVLVSFINQRLRLVIAVEIVRDKVVIAMFFNRTDESRKGPSITKGTFLNFLEDFGEIGIDGV
jgi:hypothetical protein